MDLRIVKQVPFKWVFLGYLFFRLEYFTNINPMNINPQQHNFNKEMEKGEKAISTPNRK